MLLVVLISCSTAFVASHLLLSHGSIRQGLIDRFTSIGFKVFYSLISLATLGPACWIGWRHRHLGPQLYELPGWLELGLALPLTLLSAILLILAFANPSPASLLPATLESRGILRVTRHPVNMAFACWSLSHIIANGWLGDIAFYGAFLLIGILGPIHMDGRLLPKTDPEKAEFRRRTSILPFLAIVMRRNRLVLSELPAPMLFVAAAIWLSGVLLHARLTGAGLF